MKELVGKLLDLHPDLKETFEEEALKIFCKNWFQLVSFKYRTLKEEFAEMNKEAIWEMNDMINWYFVFRAVDLFKEAQGKAPGPGNEASLKALCLGVIEACQTTPEEVQFDEKYIAEM